MEFMSGSHRQRRLPSARRAVNIACTATVVEHVHAVNECTDDGRRLRKPLVTLVSTSTAMAMTQRASSVGERSGSSATIRTGLFGVQMRRTDPNGRRRAAMPRACAGHRRWRTVVDMEEVTGSIPVSPTNVYAGRQPVTEISVTGLMHVGHYDGSKLGAQDPQPRVSDDESTPRPRRQCIAEGTAILGSGVESVAAHKIINVLSRCHACAPGLACCRRIAVGG